MPAKSKSQQRLMGMVHAYKKGELKTSDIPASLRKKVKKIAGGIKDKSAKEFAKTKHKGLPEKVSEAAEAYKCPACKKRTATKDRKKIDPESGLPELKCRDPKCGYDFATRKVTFRENVKPTFKEFLIEITQKERQMLVPPPAIQKLYAQIKKKHGIVKRDVFFNALADRLNLSPAGLQQLMQKPALRALPFDDVSQADKPLVAPRDPWAHVTQKFAKREDRAKRVGLNMESINENVHADLILSWIDANDGTFDDWYVSDRGDIIVFYEPPEFEDEGMDKLIVYRSDVNLSDWKKLKTLAKQLPKY